MNFRNFNLRHFLIALPVLLAATAATYIPLSKIAGGAAGSIPVSDGTHEVALAIGTSTNVLTSNGTTATWAAIPAPWNIADAEVPSGTVNGSNLSFTLAHTPSPSTSLKVYADGVRMTAGGVDYTYSAPGGTPTITFGATDQTPKNTIVVDYRY